jgi:ATP-dependent helicase/nuclease subunit B
MSNVHIICGPAGSGKTDRLLQRYRQVARAQLGAALWLAPTIRAAEALRVRLLESAPALLMPRLMTFQDFVEEIIRCNDPAARPLTHVQRRLLADDLVAELFRQGQLSHFQGVIDTRGFAEAVFALLAELKQQETWAEQFASAVARLSDDRQLDPNSIRKATQCALVYRRYQEHLTRYELYDLEGRYWRARDLLARGARAPFNGVRAVFVDGFTEFTHTQHEILEALGSTADELWMALLYESDSQRAEMFQRAHATLARLQRLHPVLEELPRRERAAAGLAHLERELFRPWQTLERSRDADGLAIIEAPGMVGEARLVARHIKTLLLAGVAAQDILVTLRELPPYVDLLREVFAEYAIPLDVEGTDALWRNPAVALLVRALRLPDDDWRFAAVTALLRNGYFRPDWPAVREAPSVIEESEVLLRLLGEPRGRDAYLAAIATWADRPPPRREDEEAEEPRRQLTHRLAKTCRAFVEQFFHTWDAAPARATLAEHVAWLRQLAEELGIERSANRDERDREALARLWDELERWRDLHDRIHVDVRPIERKAFLRMLVALTAEAGLGRTQRGGGRVRVLSAELARHLNADYVFVMGLGERGFPRLVAPEPLFDEAERQALCKVGVTVPCLSEQLPQEMLLFYQLVTSTRRQLILSYPAVDDKGQMLLASSFLDKLRDHFETDAIPLLRRRMLIEALDRDMPLSPAEERVQQARKRVENRKARSSPMLDAEEVARQRFESPDHGIYDGLLRDPRIVADIDKLFRPQRILSPTALEHYIACPFRFFLGNVLRLRPLDEPRDEIESTERGTTVHLALYRLHMRLRAEGRDHRSPQVEEEFRQRLDEAIEECAVQSNPAAKVLWRIEGQRLQRQAQHYGVHWEQFAAPWQPRHVVPSPQWFEVSFGLPDVDGNVPHGPLVIVADGVEVRISGRIDRVDVAELPDGGGVGFWIIDYKTGRAGYYTGSDLKTFRKLQLTLYALAVEQVLLGDKNARPLGLAYWLVTDTGPKVALPAHPKSLGWFDETESWRAIRAELEGWVVTLARHIRQGDFPLKPRDENCTETCDFGQICRISQTRAVVANKSWELPLPTG